MIAYSMFLNPNLPIYCSTAIVSVSGCKSLMNSYKMSMSLFTTTIALGADISYTPAFAIMLSLISFSAGLF